MSCGGLLAARGGALLPTPHAASSQVVHFALHILFKDHEDLAVTKHLVLTNTYTRACVQHFLSRKPVCVLSSTQQKAADKGKG